MSKISKPLLGCQPGSQGTTLLSNGRECEMPLLTHRARSFGAFFTISAAKARALLPTGDLRPVLVTPRRALLIVQAMEYTEKNTDPYREFGISIPVHRSPRADLPFVSAALWPRLPGYGNYITHLAVDTEEALLIGREVLGFPKFTAKVQFSESADERIVEASADGQAIFTFAARKAQKGYAKRRQDFHCYSLSPIENTLFHIPYQLEAETGFTPGSRSARLHLGSHPVADELRDLDLSAAPLLSMDVPQYSLVSNRPERKTDVGGWRDPRSFYRKLREESALVAS